MSKEGYFSLVFGLGAISWAVVQSMYPVISSTTGWPIVGILGILAVSFLIIGIRKKESQKSLVLTPHAWAIGLSGMTGYPDEPRNEAWLRLEVSVNAIDKPIDTLDLIIDSKTIPANHWHGKNVTAFTVYFKVTEWHWKGEYQVELIAKVGNNMPSSGRFPIDFNAEPGGFPRYL
jgi:heme/copper-type cytochrome/quinol oxidase subunit 2